MSNLDMWNRVCETPPSHTKKVNQKGGFTAIDAHYQVMRATEEFGPVGKGWGYSVVHGIIETKKETYCIADVTVWHTSRDNVFGPWRGCQPILSAKDYPDSDAPKKATTDALTKALSHIGIGADVFLGMYDDNKYVADLQKKEVQEKALKGFNPAPDIANLQNCQTEQSIGEWWKALSPVAKNSAEVKNAGAKRKQEILAAQQQQPEQPELLTDKQRIAIQAAYDGMEKEERLRLIGLIINRKLDSVNSLTKQEAMLVLDSTTRENK